MENVFGNSRELILMQVEMCNVAEMRKQPIKNCLNLCMGNLMVVYNYLTLECIGS